LNYWHSNEQGCEIYPDKKSWSKITSRYSRHYCKTHNVTLGHQADVGASQSGWQLHFYLGTASITDLDIYYRLKHRAMTAAQAKKIKRQMSVPETQN